MMGKDSTKAFGFLETAARSRKPRKVGITEIRDRGMGMNQLTDLCETAGEYIDVLKTSSGSQRLFTRKLMKKKIDLCRKYGIEVSTGGLLERVLLEGPAAVRMFMEEAKDLGFSIVEISAGLLILPMEHQLELIRFAAEYGLKPEPEVAQAYGSKPGSQTPISTVKLIDDIKRCLDAGAYMVIVEEDGISQNVDVMKEDVIYQVAVSCGLKDLIFEASDPHVFNWYIKHFGPEVNLFVDNSQIFTLEILRTGIWGRENTWGRVATFTREGMEG